MRATGGHREECPSSDEAPHAIFQHPFLSNMSIQADVHSFREVVPPNANFVGIFDWLCHE
jgi:hypothetical protein